LDDRLKRLTIGKHYPLGIGPFFCQTKKTIGKRNEKKSFAFSPLFPFCPLDGKATRATVFARTGGATIDRIVRHSMRQEKGQRRPKLFF
jgi:hypothetical protein